MMNNEEHCLCAECQSHHIHPILTEEEKARILRRAHEIAREAHAKVDRLVGQALTGQAA